MSFWTAIVVIVAILAVTATRIARYRAGSADRRSVAGHRQHPAASREAELEREVEDLHTRIEVLERIVTDERGSRAIAAEIESLRDR